MYNSITKIQESIAEYEDILNDTYLILKNLSTVSYIGDFCIDDLTVGFETAVVSVSDGYTNWQIEFPSKYYLMMPHEYIADWKNLKAEEERKKQEEIAKFEAANKKREEELEYKKYLELKEKFEDKTLTQKLMEMEGK